jgi:thiamine biosynthesis protein ThiI
MVSHMPLITVRYHEIALKGGNRPRFVACLIENLRRATSDLGLRSIRHVAGRLIMDFGEPQDTERERASRERVGWVFGVANYSHAICVPRDLDALGSAVLEAVGGQDFATFRVVCKRADKSFQWTSPDVCRELGAQVRAATGAAVNLDHAELTIDVEILHREALVSLEKIAGPGGLPVGSGGHVVALLSGGIDSPVAATRLMRRGCRVTFVHFHGAPYLDRTSQDKACELVALLTRHQYRSELYLVPFGDLQREIVVQVHRPHRVVLYRRMMVRIAEAIARRVGAEALVTGESVGQVASQTLPNLATIGAVASMPILRPLVGCDKDEIIAQAKHLGTYPISTIPDQDCCQLFVPRHPSTRTRAADAAALETAFDVDALCARAVDAATVTTFEFPPRLTSHAHGTAVGGYEGG